MDYRIYGINPILVERHQGTTGTQSCERVVFLLYLLVEIYHSLIYPLKQTTTNRHQNLIQN